MREQAALAGTTGLTFGGVEDLSLAELGEVLTDIDQLYSRCAGLWDPPDWPHTPLDLNLRPRIKRISLNSPLEVLLEIPGVAWQAGFGFTFAAALAMIFKLPARFQKERWQFWQTRLAADVAKREWIESREAQYAESPIALEELQLPDEALKLLEQRDDS